MRKAINNLFKIFRQQRLTQAESDSIRVQLLALMEKEPVSLESFGRQLIMRTNGSYSHLFLTSKPMLIGSIIALLIVASAGGASYAAEGAMPGDWLYPVKLQINERVVSALAFSDEAEADWQIKLVGRRLAEAEELAVENGLTQERLEKIEENFQKKTEKTQSLIEKLKGKGNEEAAAAISSALEASLAVHADVIQKLSELDASEGTVNFLEKVAIKTKAAALGRLETEEGVVALIDSRVAAAASAIIGAAQNKIDEVQNHLENRKPTISDEAAAKAEAMLDEARVVLVEAQASLDSASYGEAFVKAQNSMRLAQQAQLVINLSMKLNGHFIFKQELSDDDKEDGNQTATSTNSISTGAMIKLKLKQIRNILQEAREIKTEIKVEIEGLDDDEDEDEKSSSGESVDDDADLTDGNNEDEDEDEGEASEEDDDDLININDSSKIEIENQNGNSTTSQDSASNSGTGGNNAMTAPAIKIFNVSGQSFSFSPSEIKVKQGDMVRIVFTSIDGHHDWVVDGYNVETARVSAGGASAVEFTADRKGNFSFYCSVGDHEQLGMKGVLVVE